MLHQRFFYYPERLSKQYGSGTISLLVRWGLFKVFKISKLSDYAAMIMNHFALHVDKLFSAAELAEAISLAPATVSKLLKLLSDAQLLTSVRGAHGGYRLQRSPVEISLADVLLSVEGAIAMTECSSDINHCHHDSSCTMKHNWQLINRTFLSALENISIEQMSQPLLNHQLMQSGIRFIPVVEEGSV